MRLIFMRVFLLLLSIASCLASNCSLFTGNYTCNCDACPFASTEPLSCPFNMSTAATGAGSISDCVCQAGLSGNNTVGCAACPAKSYCALGVTYTCPFGMTETSALPSTPADCKCAVGTYGNHSVGCTACPAGSFCNGGVLYQCPLNTVSDARSSSFLNCHCKQGMHGTVLGPSQAECTACPPNTYCPAAPTQNKCSC